jgi:phosphoribosylglycinamide formyltransferase-1
MIKQIYTPIPGKRMNVVVFGSGSGTNLEVLLQIPKPQFEIKALFSDRNCRFQELGHSAGIPVIYHSYIKFSKEHGNARSQFDAENARLISERVETVDLILLAGYMRLVYPPLLNRFKDKIINIHPADLTQLNSEGKRRYTGAHAVYDALCAGETRTRSSVILVDENVDTGPILASGPWVTYEEGFPVTVESARLHQIKQKAQSDWPVCVKAVTAIAEGRIGLDEHKKVYTDGGLGCAEYLEL